MSDFKFIAKVKIYIKLVVSNKRSDKQNYSVMLFFFLILSSFTKQQQQQSTWKNWIISEAGGDLTWWLLLVCVGLSSVLKNLDKSEEMFW